MSPSIGVNLRVTGHCSQGGRKYMEDFFSVAYQQSEDEKDLEYAFFGIYDGHGGSEAATYAKEHLMNAIVNQKLFWSDCDQDILRAIREGYIATHYAMWREQEKWPRTATGLPSTAGTTASVAFIRHGKIYIGHVGDSGIVLGYQEEGEKCWRAKPLTHDHKPECHVEKARIMNSGGKVVTKSGVPRVVWNRPRIGHKGPVRRSTPIDEIPFLAVARSLGDLWSYNSALNEFVVSPDPDVKVVKINPKTFRCLIFGTDGLWNVISPSDSIDLARDAEIINERLAYVEGAAEWTNPSKCLVDKALERWCSRKMRADNTSVVTVMLDPPGPPKKEMIQNCSTASYGLEYIHFDGTNYGHHLGHEYADNSPMASYPVLDNSTVAGMYEHTIGDTSGNGHNAIDSYAIPTNGYAIMTRYENNCDSNILYYENRNDTMPLTNNITTAPIPSQCSGNADNVASSSSISHTELQYMNSFAESYNSLLISSYENEGDNMNTDDGLVSDVDAREFHSYHSLEESGIVGQDHVHHHHPHTIHQQQQHQYQQQCMSAEEGYSLTKLETRCEQQFRQEYRSSNQNSHLGPVSSHLSPSSSSSFQEFSKGNGYNQYDNITSSYQQTSSSPNSRSNSQEANCHNDREDNFMTTPPQAINPNSEDEDTNDDNKRRLYEPNLEISTELDKDYNFTNIEMSLMEDDNSNSNNRLLLDESIQINEISSSVIEPVILTEENDKKIIEDDLSNSDTEMRVVFETSECDEQKTPRTRRANKRLFEDQVIVKSTNKNTKTNSNQKKPILIEQNENISILEPRKLRSTVNCNKRNLRSRDSLAKDMKAKSINKKSQQHQHQQQLRRNVNNYLKVSNSSTITVSLSNTNIKTRQFQQLQQEQITNWSSSSSTSPRQKRSKTSPIVRRTAADTSSIKSSYNSNLRNKPKSLYNKLQSKTLSSSLLARNLSPSPPSTPSSVLSSSPSSLIVSSSTYTLPTKRSSSSTTSKNSAWYNSGSKSAVQTRNRVQKRLSH